jgi:nucleoside 2-deoxyribosyltransferase
MKIYIAGKITGNENYKKEFKEAEDELIMQGHTVLNPSFMPMGFEETEYHHVNRAMIDICDAICFLPNWTDSKGAHMEMGYALGKRKLIMHSATKA